MKDIFFWVQGASLLLMPYFVIDYSLPAGSDIVMENSLYKISVMYIYNTY